MYAVYAACMHAVHAHYAAYAVYDVPVSMYCHLVTVKRFAEFLSIRSLWGWSAPRKKKLSKWNFGIGVL